MLRQILRDMLFPSTPEVDPPQPRPRVLNVGGGSKQIPIPPYFRQWEHLLLDIDPRGEPDIVCDARELLTLPASQFDAVYCSHNLEHYFRHDGIKVLSGFYHILKDGGFVEIRVPDIHLVMKRVTETGIGLNDALYESEMAPITVLDVIYGLGKAIEQSGNDFYAHKTGFSQSLLKAVLTRCGFLHVYMYEAPDMFEARALAFKSAPTLLQREMLDLPES